MAAHPRLLTDTFGRVHTYLRMALTERCNLRCIYCMPEEGIALSPKSHIMTYEEVYAIASLFVRYGVTKIRITGGEPLIRKDINSILKKLSSLPVELAITTNGVIVDRFIPSFKACGIKKLNVSLDSLQADKNHTLTRRDYFQKVYNNILLLVAEGFTVKVNCVLLKGFNDNEILDFIRLTKELPLHVRFIEFMPFDGNRWKLKKLVSLSDILKTAHSAFAKSAIIRLKDAPNDTAKRYRIADYKGTFAVISSVTRPFCDGCNRIRLTANGHLKNCLFSTSESDLLTPFRQGKDIEPVIASVMRHKKKIRNGMETLESFTDIDAHGKNRSMIAIGG